MNVRMQFLTLLFSLALHGALAAMGFAVSNVDNAQSEEKVYRVSLAEFTPAGPVAETAAATDGKIPDSEPAVAAEAKAEPAPVAEPEPKPEPEPEPAMQQEQRDAPVPSPAPVKKKTRKPKKKIKKKVKKAPPREPAQKDVPVKGKKSPEQTASSTAAVSHTASARGGGPSQAGLRSIGGLSAYDADVVDQRPAITRKALPEYPASARRRNLQGKVVVRIVVDTSGTPRQCVVHDSTPPGVFDQAALAAAGKTRFIPGKINGRPVNTIILLPYYFALR